MGILLGIQIFMGLFFLFFFLFFLFWPQKFLGLVLDGRGWEEEQEKWDGRGGICIKAPGFSSRADPNFQGAPKFPNFAG